MGKKFDFSGWATKNDLKCSDGRIIRRDAFKDNDGMKVPLVWDHQHGYPENILGHALLENREDGVYAYCSCNDTPEGRRAKSLVEHGDLTSLSIFANKLQQKGGDVIHGMIREVSLVLAGANPGAVIDYPSLEHSDDEDSEFTGTMFYNEPIEIAHSEDLDVDAVDELEHADNKSVMDVINEFTDEQKKVVGYIISTVLTGQTESEDGGKDMKHNLFEGKEKEEKDDVIAHGEALASILNDGKRFGSLKESFIQHAEEYGIENIEYLFPDAKALTNAPEFIKRNDDWVSEFMSATHHTPFSRIKSIFANITEDDARAKGYIKGNMKKEEFFALIKRITGPTTIYKKQKLDRDDMVDITDFDIVAWLKTEMRMMLDEEIARAALIGDGRIAGSEDKISEDCIRPIWKDDNTLFTINQVLNFTSAMSDEQKAKAFIKAAIKGRKGYKGSGRPTLYCTEDLLTDMLLIEDGQGHDLYEDETKLAKKLRVAKIVTVPVMENQSRAVNGVTRNLMGIIVNPADYNFGADKGGSVNMFDDFDIDYNQQKYLIETRCSGALTKPFSAIILESVATA